MNRFAAMGLFIEAAKGQTIVVLTPRGLEARRARDCFARIDEVQAWPGVRTSRANGAERIDLGGRGRIDFRSAGSSLRGMSADLVYIDDEADRRLEDAGRDRLYRDLRAITSAAESPEVVRA